MRIFLSPQRRDDSLSVTKVGDVLTINGDIFDFSRLPDGATLPREAIDCEFVAGDVERVDGELVVPMILPHGPSPPQHIAFPEPLISVPDGPVDLPAEPLEPKPEGPAEP